LNQLHEQQELLPSKKEEISHEQRKKALRYLMFLKEKRDGSNKPEDLQMADQSKSVP